MRSATVVQAVADGIGAAGFVLFASIATGIGTAPLALSGLGLSALSVLVRVVAVARVRRGLDRVTTARRSWRRWIHALWLVQGLAFVAGLVLAHSSLGAVMAAVLAGVVVAVASAALVGGAARRAGRGSGFVDSASITAYA
ncbi:hypothetical protein JOE38_002434 [Clavibacter michiganensis]|uniref:hypothetical protein n=1 Tax=Clavibacter michiganensis TaxID=28447 RepID=UPI00195C287A|nr:hypothetical protein [Clavibacter michiganensis]MBM7412611.1 hypothetical protein [Clavibacter michiganensis]